MNIIRRNVSLRISRRNVSLRISKLFIHKQKYEHFGLSTLGKTNKKFVYFFPENSQNNEAIEYQFQIVNLRNCL